jgi:hypothetical protein
VLPDTAGLRNRVKTLLFIGLGGPSVSQPDGFQVATNSIANYVQWTWT